MMALSQSHHVHTVLIIAMSEFTLFLHIHCTEVGGLLCVFLVECSKLKKKTSFVQYELIFHI